MATREDQEVTKRYPGAGIRWSNGVCKVIDSKGNTLGSVTMDPNRLAKTADDAWREAAKKQGIDV